jgi:putative membrane protein
VGHFELEYARDCQKAGNPQPKKEIDMLRTKVVKGMLGLSAVAALFAALAVHAQSTGTQSTTQGGTGQTTTSGQTSGQTGTQSDTTAGTGTAAMKDTLSRADKKMVTNMAMANMAEIEAGRLAQSKSQSEQVKNFAQQMIDDHTKALNDVQQLAQSKGIALPTTLDRTHKTKADKLAALSGEAFDRAYMQQAGVSDHKKTHDMLRQAQNRAKDPDLKALAARTLPIVDQHLNSANQLHKDTARGSSRTQGTTGSSPDKKQEQPPAQ